MKDACEEAARAVARDGDHDAARRVLHAFAWGFANASSSIECAMSAIEDAPNAKARGAKPIGEASLSADVLGAAVPPAPTFLEQK